MSHAIRVASSMVRCEIPTTVSALCLPASWRLCLPLPLNLYCHSETVSFDAMSLRGREYLLQLTFAYRGGRACAAESRNASAGDRQGESMQLGCDRSIMSGCVPMPARAMRSPAPPLSPRASPAGSSDSAFSLRSSVRSPGGEESLRRLADVAA